VLPGKAIIGAALALLCAAAVLAPSAGATKPCPIEYCTDSSGEYVLEVPPLTKLYPPYADCIWNVHVDFGDGTDEEYLFDAAIGMTGSHVYPTPGTTYTVVAVLSNGHHGQTKDPCLDYSLSGEVLYRTPAEEADDPPFVPTDQGGTVPPLLPVAPYTVTPNAWTPTPTPPPPTPAAATYWLQCHGGVLTHLVSCRKGHKIAKAASGRLTRSGTAQVIGFTCRLRSPRSTVCRRGEQRVLDERPS
jgi:hypothetical protein